MQQQAFTFFEAKDRNISPTGKNINISRPGDNCSLSYDKRLSYFSITKPKKYVPIMWQQALPFSPVRNKQTTKKHKKERKKQINKERKGGRKKERKKKKPTTTKKERNKQTTPPNPQHPLTVRQSYPTRRPSKARNLGMVSSVLTTILLMNSVPKNDCDVSC